jgi:hypothetical protein
MAVKHNHVVSYRKGKFKIKTNVGTRDVLQLSMQPWINNLVFIESSADRHYLLRLKRKCKMNNLHAKLKAGML